MSHARCSSRATPFGAAAVVFSSILTTSPAFAGAQDDTSKLPVPYPEATRGEAAIAAVGDRLADVAAQNEISVEALTRLLRDDPTAWLDRDGRVFFVDEMPAARDDSSGSSILASSSIPTSEAFKLHSRPQADRIIYLDFTGHHSVNNSWGHDIVFPAFDTNGDPNVFSETELLSIISHWQRMAEDYAPFDVDVTTEEPPTHRLIKSGGGDKQWGVRDLHTQATAGFGNGIGGVAYLNSFNDNVDNPVFSFNKGSNNGAMTGSHETGHSLGLSHDGLNGSAYHPGTGSGETSWGPIMGAPFGKSLTQWSNGDYAGSSTTEDDFSVITKTTHGLTVKPDDYGDAVTNATPISLGACPNPGGAELTGLIETRTDRDAFRFTSAGGLHTFVAIPTAPGGNLDILLEVYGPNGQLIASDNPDNGVSASLSLTLPVGNHTVLVDGVGKSGVSSDYGSVGVYTLYVNGPESASAFTDLGHALAGSTTPVLTGTGVACAGTEVKLSLSNARALSPAFLIYGVGQRNAPFMGGTLVPNIGLGGLISLQTNVFGILSLAAPLPSPVPSGIAVSFQYWISDPLGPQGLQASNAVEFAFP